MQKKCLKVENMKKLFPLKQAKHSMMKRKNEKYLLNNVNTERYKRSAIPFMKELLNKEEFKIKSALKVLVMVPENIVFLTLSL